MKKKRATELDFLRYFYVNADLGPADSYVRDIMMERFVATKGMSLPSGYKLSDGESEPQ